MKRALLDAVAAARRDNRPVVVATRLADGTQLLFDPAGGGDAVDPPIAEAAREGLRRDRSQTL